MGARPICPTPPPAHYLILVRATDGAHPGPDAPDLALDLGLRRPDVGVLLDSLLDAGPQALARRWRGFRSEDGIAQVSRCDVRLRRLNGIDEVQLSLVMSANTEVIEAWSRWANDPGQTADRTDLILQPRQDAPDDLLDAPIILGLLVDLRTEIGNQCERAGHP